MPDINALREIIPVLYELERQERFYMSSWASGIVNPNAHTITECGTQFCMAGAKARYDGWLPMMRQTWVGDKQVWTATGHFIKADEAELRFSGRHDIGQDAESIARRAFGLSDDQAHFLFYGTHISRVSDLVRRIEWIIEGNHPSEFPDAFVDEEHRHAEADAPLIQRLGDRADID